jgi:hypothetical protein
MRTLALAAILVLSLASVAQPQTVLTPPTPRGGPPSILDACLGGSVEALVPKPPVVSAPFQDGVIEAWRFQCLEGSGLGALGAPVASYIPIIRAKGISSCEPVGIAAESRFPRFWPFPPAFTWEVVLCGDSQHAVPAPSGEPNPSLNSLVLGEAPIGVFVNDRWLVFVPAIWGPFLTLVNDGCNPCRIGDRARVKALISNGPTTGVIEMNLVGVLEVPGHSELPLSPQALVVPLGSSEVVIFDGPVPDTAPVGAYFFESALLTPGAGVTRSRDRLRVDRVE